MILPCHISVRKSLWAESGRQWSSRPDPTQTPSGQQRNQRVINVLLKMAHPSTWLTFVLMLKMISGGPALDQPFLCSLLRDQWDERIRSLGILQSLTSRSLSGGGEGLFLRPLPRDLDPPLRQARSSSSLMGVEGLCTVSKSPGSVCKHRQD